MRSRASIAWWTSGQGLGIVAVLHHEMTRTCCHLRSWEHCTHRQMSRQEPNQEIMCSFINVYCLYSTYQPWFKLLGDATVNRALRSRLCSWLYSACEEPVQQTGHCKSLAVEVEGGSWGRSIWSTYWKSLLGRWLGTVSQMIRKSKSRPRLRRGCSSQTEDYKQGPEGSEHNN